MSALQINRERSARRLEALLALQRACNQYRHAKHLDMPNGLYSIEVTVLGAALEYAEAMWEERQ